MTSPPDFKVDLTNCEREPIHALGNIQPFGFLIAVSADWLASRVTANADAFVTMPAHGLLSQPLTTLFSEHALHTIRNRIALLRGPAAGRGRTVLFRRVGRRSSGSSCARVLKVMRAIAIW